VSLKETAKKGSKQSFLPPTPQYVAVKDK